MFAEDGWFSHLRASSLGAAALALLLAAAADFLIRRISRRITRPATAADPQLPNHERRAQRWLREGLIAALPPLSILIWVQALYFVLSALLREWPVLATTPQVSTALTWLRGALTIAALFWLLLRIGQIIERQLVAVARQTRARWDDIVLPLGGKAARLLLPLLAIVLGAPALLISPGFERLFRDGISLMIIGTVAFLLFQLVDATHQVLLQQYRLDVQDNYRARTIHTQVSVLKRVAVMVIGLFTLASMLMVFDPVRRFGTTILASAGVAGIVIGFAAQKSIATLLAGFHIALTQPIRLDDVVIVENEWGRIEEITLTYVVVNIWDMRRLIVPITYFTEKPFQNWTRTTTQILGTVMLYLDYSVPVDVVRGELDRILNASTLWDGKVKVLQVTDAKERYIELRVLVSASDAGRSFDLRCEIREKLIHYLQTHHAQSFPRMRVELQSERPPEASGVNQR